MCFGGGDFHSGSLVKLSSDLRVVVDMFSVCFVCVVVSVGFVFVLVGVSLDVFFLVGLYVLLFGGRSCTVTLIPS